MIAQIVEKVLYVVIHFGVYAYNSVIILFWHFHIGAAVSAESLMAIGQLTCINDTDGSLGSVADGKILAVIASG